MHVNGIGEVRVHRAVCDNLRLHKDGNRHGSRDNHLLFLLLLVVDGNGARDVYGNAEVSRVDFASLVRGHENASSLLSTLSTILRLLHCRVNTNSILDPSSYQSVQSP